MAISSIHIETSKASALIHNERVFSPDYLISNDKSVNEKKHYDNKHISELEKLAKIDYQTHSKNNRKLPKTATLIKEAIINLEAHHNINDLEKVKDTLEKEYGYKITDISIHRDEGYIYTDKKNYTMGRNQYKNLEDTPHIAELDSKDNKFYEWNFINNKWIKGDEIKDYKIEYNYHAHIVMLNYDFSIHRTIRNSLKDLSKMQTLVANDLGMQRGKCSSIVEAKKLGVQVQESRKRVNIKDWKIQTRKEKELKKENEELKKEIYNFREMQKSITAMELTTDEKKELHRLNSKVKNQTATIQELNKRIEELNKDIFHPTYTYEKDNSPAKNIDVVKQLQKKVDSLENENKALQEQNKALTIENLDLEEKIVSSQFIIAKLEQKLKNIISFANEKIKSLFQFKAYNDYKFKTSDRYKYNQFMNSKKEDYWEELVYDNPELDKHYNENLDSELIKLEDIELIKLDDIDLKEEVKENIEEKEIELKESKEIELKEIKEEKQDNHQEINLNRF